MERAAMVNNSGTNSMSTATRRVRIADSILLMNNALYCCRHRANPDRQSVQSDKMGQSLWTLCWQDFFFTARGLAEHQQKTKLLNRQQNNRSNFSLMVTANNRKPQSKLVWLSWVTEDTYLGEEVRYQTVRCSSLFLVYPDHQPISFIIHHLKAEMAKYWCDAKVKLLPLHMTPLKWAVCLISNRNTTEST